MPRLTISLRSGRILVPLVACLSLLALSIPVVSWGVGKPLHEIPEDGFTFVDRGPMELVISQSGTTDCADNNYIISKCEWSTRVVEIVPDGSFVEPGDVIAVLDSSEIHERYQEREFRYIGSIADLDRAKENLKIQRLTNQSRIANAELKLELAELQYTGFMEAESPQKEHQLESALILAEEELARVRETYEYTVSMYRRGYRTHDQCESERLKLLKSQNAFRAERDKLALFTDHSRHRSVTELSALRDEAKRDLERVRIQARASELDREISVTSNQRSYEIRRDYQERLKRNMDACTIRANRAGQVIHARQSSSSNEGIEEGSHIRYLQPIVMIPDRDRVQVTLRVHETNFRWIKPNLPATVTIDAVPNGQFIGHVSHVSPVPVSGRYPNQHLREYKVTVDLDIEGEIAREIAPGLSANVNVIADQRQSTIRTPIQSVVEVGGRYYSFVRVGDTVEERQVEIGIANGEKLEVIAGLDEGDEVVLKPRVTCASQIASMQLQSGSDERSNWLAFLK